MLLTSHTVFTSNSSQNIYPLKFCIEFDEPRAEYFDWLFDDAAYLHSTLLAASAMHDAARKQPLAKATCFHLQRTLSLLNEELSEGDAYRKNSTVYIVITLALFARLFGDYTAAETHMSGLRQIVRLRGGLKGLRRTPKLHFTIDR